MRTVRLIDVAEVIRSKNAGPFLLTLDVVFRREEEYRACRAAEVLTREGVSKLYGVPVEDVLAVIHYDPALAIKATLRRRVPSGSRGDSDVYGAQQHAPLLALEIPVGD